MYAGPLEARHDLVGFDDLLFDRPVKIGERRPHGPENILKARQARTLAWKRNLLHHIFPDKILRGLDVSLVEGFLDELANDAGIV